MTSRRYASRRKQNILAMVVLTAIAVAALWTVHPSPAYADGVTGSDSQSQTALAHEVPLYSQLENLGFEYTSCGPTALAMALNYKGEGPTPQAVVEYARSQLGKDGRPLYQPQDPAGVYTSPVGLYQVARNYGHPRMGWVSDELRAQSKLRELLAGGLPVIVDVTVSARRGGGRAAHFVLVTGIDADNTVHVNDPYGRGAGAQRLAIPWEDFLWAWQNNSDGSVLGHGWWMVVR
jgi:uncharacterized protein YvpB